MAIDVPFCIVDFAEIISCPFNGGAPWFDVVKRMPATGGPPSITLQYQAVAKHSTWFVVRAKGSKEEVVALSAPIYVSIDRQSFWKRLFFLKQKAAYEITR